MSRALQRARELFDEALARPEAERLSYVERVAGGDAELRREVELLLRFSGGDTPIFPAVGQLAESMLAGIEKNALAGHSAGAYRLIEELGRGGMGVVYRAEREDGVFQKSVAVKLARRGAFDEMFAARAAREREILARLEHPYICRIHDGGVTDEGDPYTVMELVEGTPITAYAATVKPGIRRLLQLFQSVCEAVEYAHRRLIVHLDLKPANILVDGDGRPKLLDFSISRELAGFPSAEPRLDRWIFTPDYASPEQIHGRAVDTTSDVYSLGVVLYEMLAGRRPYEVQGETLAEIVRSFDAVKPAPPGAVAIRGRRALAGDLDAIVMKALSVNPARRYGSAEQLRLDLERYLAQQPVDARPRSPAYVAGKYLRRNLGTLAIVGGLVLGLLAPTAVWETRRLLETRREAAPINENARLRQMLAAESQRLQRRAAAPGLAFDDRLQIAAACRMVGDWQTAIPAASADAELSYRTGLAALGVWSEGSAPVEREALTHRLERLRRGR